MVEYTEQDQGPPGTSPLGGKAGTITPPAAGTDADMNGVAGGVPGPVSGGQEAIADTIGRITGGSGGTGGTPKFPGTKLSYEIVPAKKEEKKAPPSIKETVDKIKAEAAQKAEKAPEPAPAAEKKVEPEKKEKQPEQKAPETEPSVIPSKRFPEDIEQPSKMPELSFGKTEEEEEAAPKQVVLPPSTTPTLPPLEQPEAGPPKIETPSSSAPILGMSSVIPSPAPNPEVTELINEVKTLLARRGRTKRR